MTLPNFAIAFLATSAALFTVPPLRWRTAVGVGATLALVALWYAPHRDELGEVSQTPYGNQISPLEAITAPFDQVLLPGLMRLDGETPIQSLAWLPLVIAIAIPVAMSPYLRNAWAAWVLCAGIVASVLALVFSGAYVVPRYASFLLVPAFVLLATGCGEILRRFRGRPAFVRSLIVACLIALLVVTFPANALHVMALPREAHRDAAELIAAEADRSSDIYLLAPQPDDLLFYLDRDTTNLTSVDAGELCGRIVEVVYVEQLWRVPPVGLPCLDRKGVRHVTFEQYARGGRIDVWFIPPAP